MTQKSTYFRATALSCGHKIRLAITIDPLFCAAAVFITLLPICQSKRNKSRKEQKAASEASKASGASKASKHQRAVSLGAEELLGQFVPEWPSMPRREPEPATPTQSDAGSAIAGGPFAAEVDMVPCPVKESFDWTDVRGASKQPIRPPVEQNWHIDVAKAQPNPAEAAAGCVFKALSLSGRAN